MGALFVLMVVAGYTVLLVACGWLFHRLTLKTSRRKAIAVPVSFVLASAFVLLPNDAWKRIPAWSALPDLCKRDAGLKIFKSISNVGGVLQVSYREDGDLPLSRQGGPGIHWLRHVGYDFVEWIDKGGTWRLNADAQSDDKAYSIDTPTARYIVQSRSEYLPRYIYMHETVIKDRATNEVLATWRSYLHPTYGVAPSSLFGWLALPIQLLVPIPECKVPQFGSLIEDTLRPKNCGLTTACSRRPQAGAADTGR
jgi:hypothetical protein